MGEYIYTLRKRKRTVNVEGDFIPVMTFEYSYKVSYSGESGYGDWGRRYATIVRNSERGAEAAWEDAGRKPTLAVYGSELWLITQPDWNDCSDREPGIKIGNLAKVQGRWHCVAQETLVELALASLEMTT